MNINPIIITGMHRSGTSLLSQILMSNNMSVGEKLDVNYESIYFQRINKWLLSCNGSSWDNPTTFNNLDEKDINILKNKLMNILNNRFTNTLYFGLSNIFMNKSFYKQKNVWGWKDPSNVFTVRVWKELFPNIKIINITRNPLDVSNSLLIRQSKLQKLDLGFQSNLLSMFLPVLSINKGNVLSSFKLSSIDDCLTLYDKYLKQMKINNIMFNDNILNINYDCLLNYPEKELLKIFDFCCMKIQNIKKFINIIDNTDINKYKSLNISYDKTLLNDLNIDF